MYLDIHIYTRINYKNRTADLEKEKPEGAWLIKVEREGFFATNMIGITKQKN